MPLFGQIKRNTEKERFMGFFNRRKHRAQRNWWETSKEFPAARQSYDPETVEYPASEFDPQGSYTGRPTDGSDRPIQDADDL